MNLQKSFTLSLLFEFYGALLTQKQQDIFVEYYFNNMSLAEIADLMSISRQAVLDSLKKSEKQLLHFEEVLHLSKKFEAQKQLVETLLKQVKPESEVSILLKQLLNTWEES
jgi:predicted DNA-binding protein YlxM (UPF0122 family)